MDRAGRPGRRAATWTDPFDRNRGNLEIYAQMVERARRAMSARCSARSIGSGIARNTLVVFTSDNGGERFSEMWPFTGVKGELLEGGMRVPLIVRWPGEIAAGTTSTQVMTTMDFLPTLLAAAGAPSDPAFPPDGENLLSGADRRRRRRDRAGCSGGTRPSDQAAVRDGDWKYLKLGGKEHLFDLSQRRARARRPQVGRARRGSTATARQLGGLERDDAALSGRQLLLRRQARSTPTVTSA